MPYKSDAQRRKFHAMLGKGQISKAVVDEFDRVDCGVDTTIEIECPECFGTQDVDLPFDKGFFLPGRERTARRKARSSSFQT